MEVFTRAFSAALNRRIAETGDHSGVLASVETLLENHRRQVLHAEETGTWEISDPSLWGQTSCLRSGKDGYHLVVTGPAPNHRTEVEVCCDTDAENVLVDVRVVDGMAMAELERSLAKVMRQKAWMRTRINRAGHPPEKTVQDHIRLLRQYNKIKDVGQQLIGLIAENRGISVGSLYGRGDYSVDPDD